MITTESTTINTTVCTPIGCAMVSRFFLSIFSSKMYPTKQEHANIIVDVEMVSLNVVPVIRGKGDVTCSFVSCPPPSPFLFWYMHTCSPFF